MIFYCNEGKWTIEEVDKDKMTCSSSDYTLGLTNFMEQKVLLLKNQPNIIKTLKHELAHVWLWEYGHNQHEKDKGYTTEDLCEIISASNGFINEVVKHYETSGDKIIIK